MIGEDLMQFAWSAGRPAPRHHHDLMLMFDFAVLCRVLCVTILFQNIPHHDRKVRSDMLIVSRALSIAARLKPRAPFQRTLCWLASFIRARCLMQTIALLFSLGATLGNEACCLLPTALAKHCCLMVPV
jgi:hypothetical protein